MNIYRYEFQVEWKQGLKPGFSNLVPKIGNLKFFRASYFSRETTMYSDYNHKHVFTYLLK